MVFGNGNGTFGSPSEFAAGGWAEHIAVADFNGDGAKDLATSNTSHNHVAVLFGSGNGTFGPPTTYPVGDYPRGIVAADFNEDDRPDLAVAIRTGSHIDLFLNNGDGTFQPHSAPDPWLGRADPLVAGDFNRDGHADLAVGGDAAAGVDVFLGLGNGNFQDFFGFRTSNSLEAQLSLTIGDFNGDGVPDLAGTEYFTPSVALLLGTGNGRFAPRSNFQLGQEENPVSVAAGDFNGDGWKDLAMGSEGSGPIHIFLNQHPFPGSCNDADSDGFGVPGTPFCPAGAVDDCNDADAGIHPGAPEICDGIDNDCDLMDGFDEDLDGSRTCSGDCNDHQGNYHPGAREFCDGMDEDCDGTPDVPGENANDIILGADGASLSWTASTGYQVTYNLYRGGFASGGSFYDQSCFHASLATPAGSDAQSPAPGAGFYYLVSGRNSCGEGTLGLNSSGAARPNALPCP